MPMRAHNGARPAHFKTRFMALAMAGLLLWLAVPYAWASLILLPTRPLLEKLNAETATPETLAAIGLYQQQAARRWATNRDYAAMGQVAYLAGEKSVLQEVLRHAPADAQNWARLAALTLKAGDRAMAERYYHQSLQQGRYLPGFMNWRLLLGVALWPHMGEAGRKATAEQAYILWHTPAHRKEFLRLARMGTIGLALRDMIATYHPEEMEEFGKRWRPPAFLKNSGQ